jgi:type II secretory pathway pseudopilin PulG
MKGFTLIQLIIILALISVVAGYFSFQMSGTVDAVKLQAVAKMIASDLRASQALAVSSHTSQQLEFDREFYTVRGVKKNIPAPVKIDTPLIFSFAPSGLPHPGFSGTLRLSAKGKTVSLILSSQGRLRIE